MKTNEIVASASSSRSDMLRDVREKDGDLAWIACQDALPPVGERVVVAHWMDRYGLYGEPGIFGPIRGTLTAEGRWLCSSYFITKGGFIAEAPTHWRPLPRIDQALERAGGGE